MNQGNTLRTPILLISVAAFIVIIAGMREAKEILVPFLLAAFIAIIATPPMFWLQRHRLPSALAITTVILAVVIVMMLLGVLIGSSVNDFSREIPNYRAQLQEKIVTPISWLNSFGIQLTKQDIYSYIDPGEAMQWASRILTGLGGALSNAFLILLTVIFMLAEAASFPSKLSVIFGGQDRLTRFQHFLDNVQTYVGIKTVTSLVTGILVSVWLAIIGVDYPLLWGVLAFVFNFVPTIGSIIAAIPAVLLALIQLGGGSALLAVCGYAVVNVVIGNGIEPKYMGRGLGLSTLVVFLSLIFWGWVLGPIGMLLSVPLTMTAKIALDSREDTRWIAVLLGPENAIKDLPSK